MPEEKKPKVYAPLNATLKTGAYGEFYAISGNAEKLVAFIEANKTDTGFINLTMSARKEVGKYGETHSVFLNDWKPTPGAATPKPF